MEEEKAKILRELATSVAADLISNAQETARQLILTTADEIKGQVAESIQVFVNGKIDKLHTILEHQNEVTDGFIKQHERDMEEMRPFVQGAAGVRLVWKGVVSLGSLAVAWLAIKNILHL